MGEVYRARDTQLEREVAIKVLPEELAADEERLRRFEREAKTLASLNHPNVAHVYGIDQSEKTRFIAMELVQGEELAARIENGKLPVTEALDVCRQIAEGLEAAHEASVVHRDLKPANVRLTPDGLVKVLDFGLAKPMSTNKNRDGASKSESDSFLMTSEGVVLGTPTYMSPEQARGKPIDRRTDVWAFGCVLFECLSGQRAFGGDSVPDIMAAILGEEPRWSLLPALPARVTELLRRALDKEPRTRLRDIGEARMQLQLAATDPSSPGGFSAVRPRTGSFRTGVLTLAGLAVGFLLGWLAGIPAQAPDPDSSAAVERDFKLVLHEFDAGQQLSEVRIAPTGPHVAWSDPDGLHVRSLTDLEATLIVSSEPASFCWSPDGRELAYAIKRTLMRVSLDGGAPTTVARHDENIFNVAWSGDDLYFSDGTARLIADIFSVPARGGEIVVRAELGEDLKDLHGFGVHPAGKIIAVPHYVATSDPVTIARFEDGNWRPFHTDSDARVIWVAPDGSVVYSKGGQMWWLPAAGDRESFEYGTAIPFGTHAAQFSMADDGTAAFVLGENQRGQTLAWFAADGTVTPIGTQRRFSLLPMLSPDGRRILFTGGWDCDGVQIWEYDLQRNFATQFLQTEKWGTTFFLPDGRIAIRGLQDRGTTVYAASGRGQPETFERSLVAVARNGSAWVWADDSAGELFWTRSESAKERTRLLGLDEGNRFLEFSRDGTWMLYSSKRSGEEQVYLARFPPSSNDDWAVSAAGASHAWFRDDLSAIVFVTTESQRVYKVALTLEPDVALDAPELMFELPDGKHVADFDGVDRFLGTERGPPGERQLVISTEWREFLR
jgi:serine/threonine-protein kinase